MHVSIKDKVALFRFKELETAIDERVPIKKFAILEKNVTDYMKKDEFKVYKEK
jgi:hypothetical protein